LLGVGIYFLDGNVGWLEEGLSTSGTSSRAYLYGTSDGGNTWTKVNASFPFAGVLAFTSSSDGWMAGGPALNQLFATSNGGVTWERQQVPFQSADGPQQVHLAVPHFLTGQDGVLPIQLLTSSSPSGSSLYFFVTHDSGKSWTPAGAPLQPERSTGDVFFGSSPNLSLADASNWYLLADQLYATHDGGVSWSAVQTNKPFRDYIDLVQIDFETAQEGWAYGETDHCLGTQHLAPNKNVPVDCTTTSHLLKTIDGGQTWAEQSIY